MQNFLPATLIGGIDHRLIARHTTIVCEVDQCTAFATRRRRNRRNGNAGVPQQAGQFGDRVIAQIVRTIARMMTMEAAVRALGDTASTTMHCLAATEAAFMRTLARDVQATDPGE